MRIDRLGTSLAMLCAILLLAACGKGGGASAANGEPLSNVAPVAAQGAVSLATRNTTRLGGADPATDAAAVARAVYPALTPATRPPLVVLVDERDWPAALAASALAGAPLGAPLLFSRGNSLPDVSRQTLEALAPLGAPALGGVQVLRIGTSAAVPKGFLTRTLARAQPPDAAAAIEPLLQSGEAPAAHAVIVLPAAATPALAMPAAGLAAESGAPILFVTQAGVPASTAAVLKRLGHPTIYVIDSPQIGAPALAALRRFGPLTNLATGSEGADPAATAIAVARFADGKFGWGVKEPGHGLVFANAARPLDAAAAAPLSATGDYGPLLLIESAAQIPPSLASYLGDIQPAYTPAFNFRPVRGVYNHGWLIGDEHAIAAVTQAELDSLLEISPRKQSSEPSVSQVE
jgi:ell wall binding domain 2 (CWB2)